MLSLNALGENLCQVFLLASGDTDNRWSSLACRSIALPQLSHDILPVCLSLCLFSSYKDAGHIALRAHPIPV